MSDIQYVYPLIHNKVTSPHYVTPLLRRGRLLDWLHGNATCRAIVIAADAGYGKTTMLWQWEQEVGFPCYWYKLDRNDRDWSLHISYLIEAISQRHEGFGRRAHSMLQQLGGPGSSRPGVAAYLLAEMHERLTEPCTFIIDDWQFVASVTEVRGLWNQILRDAPPTCRFVFLSRAKPHLQFARFKTHGGYAEMRTDALRFTDHEIDELFRDIYQDPLDPTELVELERRTEGWAASLQLVEVSLRERKSPEERRAFIESITATGDNDVFSFLAEEVLDQQPEHIRNFLLTTSIAQQVTAELAERLSGVQEGEAVLQRLERGGLFTNRLDEPGAARYRYHGLFRSFLMRRLELDRSEGEVVGLHIHAASYFETNQEWPEAIDHYLRAGLHPQAARLTARYGEDLVVEGRIGLVDEWIALLPSKTVRDNARLSMLAGEAAGIRGDWRPALDYLERARSYFARKGDARMESLALSKLSTVYSNKGDVERAAGTAEQGLVLAPTDAAAIRIRLQGNLTITSTWMSSTLPEVAQGLRRIAVEASNHGLDHLAAIALHNLGVALRHMGQARESVQSLVRAAAFWSEAPASPFGDNLELVLSLLADGQVRTASLAADSAVNRTTPWPKPHAEALLGKASVLAYRGNWGAAIHTLERALSMPQDLGPTDELLTAALVETLYLADVDGGRIAAAWHHLRPGARDPRHAPVTAPAQAIAAHVGGCDGACLRRAAVLDDWTSRGATGIGASGIVKLGAVAAEHPSGAARRMLKRGLLTAVRESLLNSHRHWLRRYRVGAQALIRDKDVGEALLAVANSDPEGWRDVLVAQLPRVSGPVRQQTLGVLASHAKRSTVAALSAVPGADVADLRRELMNRHAARLCIRSLGTLSVHRGTWDGPRVAIEKKRLRVFLGLLVANSRSALTREMVLESLWPESDPGAAVNNLNQTVFQLRRTLDPEYRDGESPQYVIATSDVVQLSDSLVRIDLEDFRDLTNQMSATEESPRHAALAAKVVTLIRGEYLADLRYEDWLAPVQASIHAEIRDTLLPLARGEGVDADLAVRAGCCLLQLDPYDDAAAEAVARQYALSGRRAAARNALRRYALRLRQELDENLSSPLAELLESLAGERQVHS